MEGSACTQARFLSLHFRSSCSPLGFCSFISLQYRTQTTVNFNTFGLTYERGLFFVVVFPPPLLPTATNPSIRNLLCLGLLSLCHKAFFVFLFELFVLPFGFLRTRVWSTLLHIKHQCCPEFFSLAEVVFRSGAVTRRSNGSLLRVLWINAPEPHSPFPSTVFAQWPNCIYAAR